MAKITKYISYILLGVGLLLTILFFINQDGMLDTYMFYAYILFFVSVVLAVVLPLISMVQNPKSIKRALIGLLGAAVLIGVSYLIASGDPVPANVAEAPSYFTLKATDASLIICYILLAISFIAIVAGSVMNMVRNR